MRPANAEARRSLSLTGKTRLAPFAQPIAQKVVQVRDLVDLADRFFDVVLDAAKAQLAVLQDDITGPAVTVTRLPHRTHVGHRFFVSQTILEADFRRADEIQALREH